MPTPAKPPLTLVSGTKKPSAAPVPDEKARRAELLRQRTEVRDEMLAQLKGTGASATHYRRLVTLDYTLTVELEGPSNAQKLISGYAQAVTFVTGKAGHFAEGDIGTNWDAKLNAIKQTSKTGSVVQDVSAQFVPAFAQAENTESAAQDVTAQQAQASTVPVAQDRKRTTRVAQQKKPPAKKKAKPKKPVNNALRTTHWADGMSVESAWQALADVDFSATYEVMTKEQKRACAYLLATDPDTFRSAFVWPLPGALSVASSHVRTRLSK